MHTWVNLTNINSNPTLNFRNSISSLRTYIIAFCIENIQTRLTLSTHIWSSTISTVIITRLTFARNNIFIIIDATLQNTWTIDQVISRETVRALNWVGGGICKTRLACWQGRRANWNYLARFCVRVVCIASLTGLAPCEWCASFAWCWT